MGSALFAFFPVLSFGCDEIDIPIKSFHEPIPTNCRRSLLLSCCLLLRLDSMANSGSHTVRLAASNRVLPRRIRLVVGGSKRSAVTAVRCVLCGSGYTTTPTPHCCCDFHCRRSLPSFRDFAEAYFIGAGATSSGGDPLPFEPLSPCVRQEYILIL
jgi:hypothetical protein